MPPLEVGTPAAAALQAAVAAELATALGPLEDDALPMYVVAMTSSGTGRAGVEAALGEFLPERAGEFAGWLFAHLVERAGEYGLTAEEAGKLAQGGDGDAGDGAGTERGRSRSRSPSAATARAMSRSRSHSGERAKAAAAAARGRGGRGRGGRGPPPTAAARSSVFDRLGSGGRGRGASSIASLPPPAASLVAAARFRELASLRLAALASPAGAASAGGRAVVVKNVHFDAGAAEVGEHFSRAGLAVEKVTVVGASSAPGARHKGYAFVVLATDRDAAGALRVAGSALAGRVLDVVPARPPGAPPPFGRGRGRGRAPAFRGRGPQSFGRGRGGRAATYVRPEAAAEAGARRKAQLDADLDAMMAK